MRISRRRTSFSSKLSPFSSYQQRSIQLFHTTYDLTLRLLQPSPQSQYFSNLKLNQYLGKHGPIDFVWTPSAQPMSTKLIQHSHILPTLTNPPHDPPLHGPPPPRRHSSSSLLHRRQRPRLPSLLRCNQPTLPRRFRQIVNSMVLPIVSYRSYSSSDLYVHLS